MALYCKASAAGLGGPNVIVVMLTLITGALGFVGLLRFCMEGLLCFIGLEHFLVEEVVGFVFGIFNNDWKFSVILITRSWLDKNFREPIKSSYFCRYYSFIHGYHICILD